MLFEVSNDESFRLRLSGRTLVQESWERLSMDILLETHLLSFDASDYQRRFEQGEAAVVICDHSIIAYTSCTASLRNGHLKMGDQTISYEPELAQLPTTYLALSGWVHPDFRRRGLNSTLKRVLHQKVIEESSLMIGVSNRIAIPPLVRKLGYQPVSRGKIPYLQAMTCLSYRMGKTIPQVLSKNQQFWVSDIQLASFLNDEIAHRLKLSILEWQQLLGTRSDWLELH